MAHKAQLSGTDVLNPLTLKISLVILLSLPYSSCDVSLENLGWNQLIIP